MNYCFLLDASPVSKLTEEAFASQGKMTEWRKKQRKKEKTTSEMGSACHRSDVDYIVRVVIVKDERKSGRNPFERKLFRKKR